jgi:hypothetical protein
VPVKAVVTVVETAVEIAVSAPAVSAAAMTSASAAMPAQGWHRYPYQGRHHQQQDCGWES